MSRISFDIAGKTDPGKVRDRNEDGIGLLPDLGLLVVADGMGGHNAGEVASGLAVDTILSFAKAMRGGPKLVVPEGGDPKRSAASRQLDHFIVSANTVIFEKARAFAKNRGMGTTVVALLLDGAVATVAHVGDSRLYLFRNGALERLTEDHSLVMDQVKHGLITEAQAEKSHLQNILTRALGTEASVAVDVQDHPVLPGDVFLLCSDGLTKMVSDAEIGAVLGREGSAASWTQTLIDLALKGGGVDNVTVAIASAQGAPAGGFSGLLGRLFGG